MTCSRCVFAALKSPFCKRYSERMACVAIVACPDAKNAIEFFTELIVGLNTVV